MTRSMPIAAIRPCRQIPGYIDARGDMICGCCRKIVGAATPTDTIRFEQD